MGIKITNVIFMPLGGLKFRLRKEHRQEQGVCRASVDESYAPRFADGCVCTVLGQECGKDGDA